ncbi:hypothetical protein D9758_004677 [Tetrapyrgos nigripes]|uniref:Uncharacterized protein n=1 Tax=Tetrapyrgos nigripes TaxID=182062 RepID=A0A8H5H0H2_9AGAR|nr:hypothetical protein D9758_004677 [Tetrapyrgos nigripes]
MLSRQPRTTNPSNANRQRKIFPLPPPPSTLPPPSSTFTSPPASSLPPPPSFPNTTGTTPPPPGNTTRTSPPPQPITSPLQFIPSSLSSLNGAAVKRGGTPTADIPRPGTPQSSTGHGSLVVGPERTNTPTPTPDRIDRISTPPFTLAGPGPNNGIAAASPLTGSEEPTTPTQKPGSQTRLNQNGTGRNQKRRRPLGRSSSSTSGSSVSSMSTSTPTTQSTQSTLSSQPYTQLPSQPTSHAQGVNSYARLGSDVSDVHPYSAFNAAAGPGAHLGPGPTLADELDNMLLDSTVHAKDELLPNPHHDIDDSDLETLLNFPSGHIDQQKLISLLSTLRSNRDHLRLELEATLRGREHLEEDLRVAEEEIKKLNAEKEEFKRNLVDLAKKLEVMEELIQEEAEQARKVAEEEKRELKRERDEVEREWEWEKGEKEEANKRARAVVEEKGKVEEERDGLKVELRKVYDEKEKMKEGLVMANKRVEELQSDLEKLKEEDERVKEDRSRMEIDKVKLEEDRGLIEEKQKNEFEKEQEMLRRDLASALEGRIVMQKNEESARESQIIAEKRALEERRARVKVEQALKQMETKMKDLDRYQQLAENREEGRRDVRGQPEGTMASNQNQMLVQSWNKTAERTMQMVYTRFQGFQTSSSPLARFWGQNAGSTSNGMVVGKEGIQRNKVLAVVKAAEEEVKRATAALSEAIRNLDLAERQAAREGLTGM